MILFAILFWVGSTLLVEIIRPKPDFEDARPAGQGDFQFTTATEGRAVPLIWGKVRIKGPNVVWYGSVSNEGITENVPTGMFSSEDVVIGHRYYVGLQFGLCKGPGVILRNIIINDKSAASVSHSGGARFWLLNKYVLGDGDPTGAGWISGACQFYGGEPDQAVNTYLAARQSPGVAYRGTCYLIFESGWIGNSPNIAPWAFDVERIPDPLNLATSDPGAEEPTTGTCNLMNAIYEVMTDTDWGLKIPSSDINITNFKDVAGTLADEGNGFAMVLDNHMNASDLLNEMIRQADGTLWYDRTTAEWNMTLYRDGYSTAGLPVFDESNILELIEFTRQTWEETTNEVRVRYTDAADDFKETYAMAQDSGNNLMQGGAVSSEVVYPGVKTPALANSIAWRELKVLSYPLSKITIKANREAYSLRPGSLFKLTWPRLGISEVVYRVGRFGQGSLTNGSIEVFAIEDVFSTGEGTFGDPIGSGWTDPAEPPVAVLAADTLVFEAPRQIVLQDPFNSSLEPRVWAGARDPGGGTVDFQMYQKLGASASHPIGGDYTGDSRITKFLIVGTLRVAMNAYATNDTRPDTANDISIDHDPDDLTDFIRAGSDSDVRSLLHIIYIDGEFIGYEKVTDWTTYVKLENIYRGLFNSVQSAHAVDDKVWFIGQSGGSLTRATMRDADIAMDLQLRSRGLVEEVTEGVTPVNYIDFDRIHLQPLPPRDPVLNGTYADTTAVSFDLQYPAGTGRTGQDASACEVGITVRGWRIPDPTLDHVLSESIPAYLTDEPVMDFDLQLDPDGTPIDVPTVTLTDDETPSAYILRNELIIAVGANANIPTDARLTVTPKHTISGAGSEISGVVLTHDFVLTSSIDDDDLLHGGIPVSTISTAVSYGETGIHNFNIYTALPSSGKLEANVDGGGWVDVVTASNTTGTLTTSGGAPYSVVLRFTQAPTADQYFSITGPTAEVGHGVLLS